MTLNRRGVFITGSDTGVGKTTVACYMIRMLEKAGFHPAPRKPIESGCVRTSDGTLIARDAQAMTESMLKPIATKRVCPYRFSAAISPARAAQLQNVPLDIDKLVTACDSEPEEVLIIEGSGGLLSPLATQCTNADLAKCLGIPLILVVADRLGCINHSLLSLVTAESLGIKTLAVIINRLPYTAPPPIEMDNFAELKAMTDIPLFRLQDLDTHNDALLKLVVANQ